MNRRGRSRFGGSPEIYYYNSARRDAVEELAGQLSGLIQEEMTRRHKKKLVFLCIGTDRSTGDSLGPLIGYKLKQERRRGTLVFGTLDRPVHAMNLEHYVQVLKNGYPDALVVAVDASVGDENHIGYVTLGRGAWRLQGASRGRRSLYHRDRGGLQPLRSDDAAEYPPGTRHAAGRLHQRGDRACRKFLPGCCLRLTNFACNRRYDRRKEIHHTPEITENHVTVFVQVFSALKMLRGAAIKSWKQVQTRFQENLS